jgi:xanthine dehydrogenase molybdopterin-binding subunit B
VGATRALGTHAPSTYKIPDRQQDWPATFNVELLGLGRNREDTSIAPKAGASRR